MKKLISFALVAAFLSSISIGCGDSNKPKEPSNKDNTEKGRTLPDKPKG